MVFFTTKRKKDFLAKSGEDKLVYIDKILRRGFVTKSSQIACEIFASVSYKETELGLEKYKRYLRSFAQLLLKEDEPVSYLEGIKTLKKCYREIHERVSYKTLIDAFAKSVFERENNMLGFDAWMQDGVKMGVLTNKQKEKLVKEYDDKSTIKLATLQENLEN